MDDCSPNFETFTEFYEELSRPFLELYSTGKRMGAGSARNVGIEHAKGDWIIFADADDYFTENFENLLIDYSNSDVDIIYFKHKNVLSDNPQIESSRCHEFNDVMTNDWLKEEKELFFRCRHNVPWAKMIRKNLIDHYHIRYEEVKYSNDVVFNIKAGCLAQSVKLVNQTLYVLTERQGSLTSNNCQSIEELLQRAEAHIKMQAIIEQYGYYKESPAMWFLPTLYNRDKKAFISALKCCRSSKLSMKKIYHDMARTTRRRTHPMLILLFILAFIQ